MNAETSQAARGEAKPAESVNATPSKRTLAGPAGDARALHASLGNRVVQRMLAATPAPSAGRGLPPAFRAATEQAYGASLGHVRLHDDDAAARRADTLGAHAFTEGPNIFFAAGRYRPNTRGGAWLLAHELAHVRQQGQATAVQAKSVLTPQTSHAELRADAAADAFMSGRPIPDVGTIPAGAVSRVVVTNGGVFDTTVYEPTRPPGSLGARIRLQFTPNDLVPRGDKIGLIQTVNAGQRYADDLHEALALPLGSVERGRAIDRSETSASGASNTNPVYGSHNRPGHIAQRLTDNPPVDGDQLGYRTYVGANVPAKLFDEPDLPFGGNRGQQFEAAAVLLNGAKAGMYLGSVAWGWRANAAGDAAVLTPNPIQIVSRGVPSAAWMAAAGHWNTHAQNGDEDLVPIPTSAAPTQARAMSVMTDQEVQQAIDAIDAQILGAAAVVGDRRQLKLEKAALLAEKERRGIFFGVNFFA